MCPPKAEQATALRAVPTADLIDPLRLGGFCALTRLAKVIICNDSGVSHLCATVGPLLVKSWHERNHFLFRTNAMSTLRLSKIFSD
jgi:ADP-heptose:LPS heptosyltransferase